MNKNKQTKKYGDPLYLKCEEIVDRNISQLFENKKKLKLVENGDNEVLTCLIFNISCSFCFNKKFSISFFLISCPFSLSIWYSFE
jgi:hypothetical protein